MKFRKLLILILLGWGALVVRGQGREEVLRMAAEMERAGDFESAYLLLDRVIFFDAKPDAQVCEKAMYYAQRAGRAKDEAALAGRLLKKDTTEAVYSKWAIAYVRASVLAPGTSYLSTLYDYADTTLLTAADKVRFYFYSGLGYLKAGQRDTAVAQFNKLKPYLDESSKEELEHLNKRLKRKSSVSPATASALSLGLPGLGQAASGAFGRGLNSFVINAALLSGGVLTAFYYPVPDAVLFWGMPFVHYYTGGAKVAADVAEERSAKVNRRFYNRYVRLLSKAPVKS